MIVANNGDNPDRGQTELDHCRCEALGNTQVVLIKDSVKLPKECAPLRTQTDPEEFTPMQSTTVHSDRSTHPRKTFKDRFSLAGGRRGCFFANLNQP